MTLKGNPTLAAAVAQQLLGGAGAGTTGTGASAGTGAGVGVCTNSSASVNTAATPTPPQHQHQQQAVPPAVVLNGNTANTNNINNDQQKQLLAAMTAAAMANASTSSTNAAPAVPGPAGPGRAQATAMSMIQQALQQATALPSGISTPAPAPAPTPGSASTPAAINPLAALFGGQVPLPPAPGAPAGGGNSSGPTTAALAAALPEPTGVDGSTAAAATTASATSRSCCMAQPRRPAPSRSAALVPLGSQACHPRRASSNCSCATGSINDGPADIRHRPTANGRGDSGRTARSRGGCPCPQEDESQEAWIVVHVVWRCQQEEQEGRGCCRRACTGSHRRGGFEQHYCYYQGLFVQEGRCVNYQKRPRPPRANTTQTAATAATSNTKSATAATAAPTKQAVVAAPAASSAVASSASSGGAGSGHLHHHVHIGHPPHPQPPISTITRAQGESAAMATPLLLPYMRKWKLEELGKFSLFVLEYVCPAQASYCVIEYFCIVSISSPVV